MKRLACLVTALIATLFATLVALPASGAEATYGAFVGDWSGHTRHLEVRADHIAREVIYDGCCTHSITVRYRITRSVGDKHDGYLRARVLRVRLGDWTGDRPHRGDVRRITVHHGVFLSHHTGATYCTPHAGAMGACGA